MSCIVCVLLMPLQGSLEGMQKIKVREVYMITIVESKAMLFEAGATSHGIQTVMGN